MLTPQELKKKELVERKKRFYDKEEVDSLLEEFYSNYEELFTKYNEMTKNAKKLSDGVQYYKSIETTLQKALVLAEKTAKDTKDAATEKAAEIEAEAQNKAQTIVEDAKKEREQIKLQCNHLVDLFKQYKSQFVQVTSNNLKLLNSKEFDIAAPELEKMYQDTKPETEAGIKKQLENTQDLVKAISANLSNPSVMEPSIKKVEEESKPTESMIEEEQAKNVQPPKIQYNQTPSADNVNTKEDIQVNSISNEVEEDKQEEVTTEEVKEAELKPEEKKELQLEPDNTSEDSETLEPNEEIKEEKSQTLDALLNDLNMNGKKQNDEDPFEFLGSLDDF